MVATFVFTESRRARINTGKHKHKCQHVFAHAHDMHRVELASHIHSESCMWQKWRKSRHD